MLSHLQSHPWQISANNRVVYVKYKTYQCCIVQKRLLTQNKVHLWPVLVGPDTVTWSTCIVTSSKKFTGCPSPAARSFFSRVPSFCGEMSLVSKSLLSFFSLHRFTPCFPFTRKTTKQLSLSLQGQVYFRTTVGCILRLSCINVHWSFDYVLHLTSSYKIFENFNIFHEYLQLSGWLANSSWGQINDFVACKAPQQDLGKSSQLQVFQLSVDHVSAEKLCQKLEECGGMLWFWGVSRSAS